MAKMHDGELDIGLPLVARLVASQFPRWAELPLRPVAPAGTDNAIFRLGDTMAVRLPRIDWAIDQPVKEREWLPVLAPHLSLAIPEPLALGEPGHGYPWHWSVCTWLPGDTATAEHLGSPREVADDLARFVRELETIDTDGGPAPAGRGEPLATRDVDTRDAIAKLGDAIDTSRVEAIWEAAVGAPLWSRPPVWLHGDLDARNLLATDGRLSGVLDFGALAVGDPAADVMVAWKMFGANDRASFRSILDVDDAIWLRARGWVLSQALMILSYYTLETNRILVTEAQRWMREVLGDTG
jgi:aminoglycoside phosphotransferase (APT) family kinase protein